MAPIGKPGKTPLLYQSWGRLTANPAMVARPEDQAALQGCVSQAPASPYLAYGNGRSYGDSCLRNGGTMVDMRSLDRVLAFDPATGILRAEAGITLANVLSLVMPAGWFLPVTPGTRFVTLGGALANDVHGKNHHRAGSFGRHVTRFELVRSDGSRILCSPTDHPGWFSATIGGMGLTGIMSWIEIQLMPVKSPDVMQETIPLANLDEFFGLIDESDAGFDYVVAWIDSLAKGRNLGRGLLLRANHADENDVTAPGEAARSPIAFAFDPPFSLINRLTLTLFNAAYRWRALSRPHFRRVSWQSFFYPLDAVQNWNRAYGPGGLRQFQCVLPRENAHDAVRKLLELSQKAGHASFLTVLKSFGSMVPVGPLSFARPGITLTLDFPYRGAITDALLAQLDHVTLQAGGAVNPYKDARMSFELFRASFPDWERIMPFLDPMAASTFSDRVGITATL